MASPTPNISLSYPGHGGSINSWDTPLNADFDAIDAVFGGTQAFTGGTATFGAAVTLTQTQANNRRISIAGVLTSNFAITFPAIGGLWVIDNLSTGAFSVTCIVTGSAVTAITCPQGFKTLISSNSVDMSLANDSQTAKFYTYLGNPNTNVAGTAGSANGGATSVIWDGTNQQIYTATTSGVAATAVWTPQLARLMPEGYLTVSADNNNPIITANTTATAITYVPYMGNWTVLSNGTILYPYQFGVMTLTMTGSQAANQLYDIFMYANPTAGIISPVIGTGPAWTTATAGSCTRGTGAGTTQISRFQGIWTNTVQVTLTNGASTYTCPANQGVYLGSIFIDSAAGNVTCNRAAGQSRKWGVSNAYNRVPTFLKVTDSTATWTYSTKTIRPSNNSTANNLTVFSGLPEEIYTIEFDQRVGNTLVGASQIAEPMIGIGWNVTNAISGKQGDSMFGNASGANAIQSFWDSKALYVVPPSLGINVVTALENTGASQTAGTNTYAGTETNMLLNAEWRA